MTNSGASGSNRDALLEISDLHTRVSSRMGVVDAVDGVDLTVRRGEIVALVGESGSGKTMTALSIMQLLPRNANIVSGSVRLNGRELTTATESEMNRVRGANVGLLFQQPRSALDPTCRIGSQVGESYREHRNASRKAGWSRSIELLRTVGIPEPVRRARGYAHQLSGGMAQRVMIASAISGEPALMIADEPTTSLDVTVQAQILRLLASKTAEAGMALLLITHDLSIVAGMADRVAVMYSGRIVEQGSSREIFDAPQHPYTRALMRASLLERDADGKLYTIPGKFVERGSVAAGCRFCHRCTVSAELGLGSRCSSEEPELLSHDDHATRCWATVKV
ncbi:MAG: putative transporter ATP-binding protein [Pseudonocardiales bacterium]|nr:putative transporter ATP-binding protein [Pseudonocardiales bacterium]